MKNKDIRESIDLIKKIHKLNENTSINELDDSTYASAIDKMTEKDFNRANEMIETIASKYVGKTYKSKNGDVFTFKGVKLLNNAIEFQIDNDSIIYKKGLDTLSKRRLPRSLAKAIQMIISEYNPDSKYANTIREFYTN